MRTRNVNRLTAGEINLLMLTRSNERYVIIYADRQRGEALRKIGSWASNQDLLLDWGDAALVSRKMREGPQDVERRTVATVTITAHATVERARGTKQALLSRLLRAFG